MDEAQYRGVIDSIGARKRLGQNFLIKRHVAVAEADYCRGKDVIELGAGLGVLTEELCRVARRVTSVEVDMRLYRFLVSGLKCGNCTILNDDFFSMKKYPHADMMASNVPYSLSSRTLMWLAGKRMPAVLCLQREFAERMVAEPGSGGYSRLSVFCSLQFEVELGMRVPANSFYPVPKVDSMVVVMKPKRAMANASELNIISLMMEHKSKKVRNAIEDSSRYLKLSKDKARRIADSLEHSSERVEKLWPDELVAVARELLSSLE